VPSPIAGPRQAPLGDGEIGDVSVHQIIKNA
jgi:hypothetical protein